MPDVSACGGIAETLAVGEAARAAGAALTLHSSSSIVLFLASLHVAAACPATHSVEMHRVHRWFEDLAPGGALVVSDGAVTLGTLPGIGIDPADLHAQIAAVPS